MNRAGGVLAWQGLPGDSIGGLASGQRAIVSTEPYRVLAAGQSPGISGLPVQSASSKSLSLRSWGSTASQPASSLVRNSYGALDGEVVNSLPVGLSDCLVAFEDKLYRLGKLAPLQSVDLGSRSPLNLEARITQKTVEGAREVSTLWKRDSTDLPRIVQMLMFHEVARGRNYTGLTHRYQPYLDLSDHLRLNRAVLVGRADEPVTQLVHADGRPLAATEDMSSETWFRFVFPVSTHPAAASATVIKTHNLTKKYGELFAIQAIELDLAAGDLFGFIGPNGAGKTTTMKILATLLDPTYGEAYVCGHSIYQATPRKSAGWSATCPISSACMTT